LIQSRNGDVTAHLRDLYANAIPGNDLRIFCVDNELYKLHRNEPAEAALPKLELSGILDLRRHCIGIVAESQLRIATIYLRNDVSALLADLSLWVQSGSGTVTAERKERVRQAVAAMEAVLKRVSRLSPTVHCSRFIDNAKIS
jgi:hypothetical protein